jgi:hypothetical protein
VPWRLLLRERLAAAPVVLRTASREHDSFAARLAEGLHESARRGDPVPVRRVFPVAAVLGGPREVEEMRCPEPAEEGLAGAGVEQVELVPGVDRNLRRVRARDGVHLEAHPGERRDGGPPDEAGRPGDDGPAHMRARPSGSGIIA